MEQSRGLVRVNRNEHGDDRIEGRPAHRISVSNRSKWRFEEDQKLLAYPDQRFLRTSPA
ncbi:unnamed protein product [Sphenostylis stenocarpa]|uniref:Uncharacterized protein n=1 Tax=Sphenostylis stenocarpa TaxID=92480 RepID=A0AA86T9W3_9FABA|nr:unnamed protein product [Sphenostylis stenocarpa]